MASVTLSNVIKRYGKGPSANQVIHGVNAEIADGEFVVIVGPSGCGKSTLLRMVAGLEEISDGTVKIGERVVNDLEPVERDIAMVFQNYALYPHMSVYDNMAYGLRTRKQLDEAAIRAKIEHVAASLELSPYLQRKPSQLSGGQRQRVAMGRAIVREPNVFLFDEPLSNLDAKLRVQTRLEIQSLHRSLGVTSLFVTHDQVEAMTLAQRIMVLNGGRLEQFATPAEIYRAPASTFVASFMGSPPMNLLRTVSGVPQGRILGVRPEHLSLHESEVAGAWPARVHALEMLGADTLVYLHLGEKEEAIARVNLPQTPYQVGQAVWVQADARELHTFDAQSGLRCH
jgi:sn-glycerol 3-phosphate transport system ATP-binding protein